MRYFISKKEINRRKNAYKTFAVSLFVGTILFSAIFDFHISYFGYVFILTILFLLGVYSWSFFRNLLQIKIILLDNILQRITGKTTEEYLLRNISSIKIKWTANNTIREIYIWLNNGKSIFISGLDQFEQFREELLVKISKNIVKEWKEPLDFDHPLFYPILGLLVSSISIFAFKSIQFLNFQYAKIGAIILFIYLLILGIYFIVAKPISKRTGKKTVFSDYIIGFLMICFGIIVLFSLFNFFQNFSLQRSTAAILYMS
jgi:hypothetical protein